MQRREAERLSALSDTYIMLTALAIGLCIGLGAYACARPQAARAKKMGRLYF
jgi:hypothetical protein